MKLLLSLVLFLSLTTAALALVDESKDGADQDESLYIEKAKHRLYPGGADEQDLEVQKVLIKPVRRVGADSSDADAREEEF